MLSCEVVKDLVILVIQARKQFEFSYTNSKGETKKYLVNQIQNVSSNSILLNGLCLSTREEFQNKKFLLNRFVDVQVSELELLVKEHFIDLIERGALFEERENRGLRTSKELIYSRPFGKNFQTLEKNQFEEILSSVPDREGYLKGVVFQFVDGDGGYLYNQQGEIKEFRLWGLDCCEMSSLKSPDQELEACFAIEALDCLESFFIQSRLCFYKQKIDCGATREIYGRLLIELFNQDGINLNLEMLKKGLGIVYLTDINEEYFLACDYAIKNRHGIWFNDELYERRQNISSTRKEIKYFVGNLKQSKVSALNKFLKQNPRREALHTVSKQKIEFEKTLRDVEQFFQIEIENLKASENYDLDLYKNFCIKYKNWIENEPEKEVWLKIRAISLILDELKLGRGSIKGNFSSKKELIYHIPEGRWYEKCDPEFQFETINDAKYCGFKKSQN